MYDVLYSAFSLAPCEFSYNASQTSNKIDCNKSVCALVLNDKIMMKEQLSAIAVGRRSTTTDGNTTLTSNPGGQSPGKGVLALPRTQSTIDMSRTLVVAC